MAHIDDSVAWSANTVENRVSDMNTVSKSDVITAVLRRVHISVADISIITSTAVTKGFLVNARCISSYDSGVLSENCIVRLKTGFVR